MGRTRNKGVLSCKSLLPTYVYLEWLKYKLKVAQDNVELERVEEEIHKIELELSILISAENTQKVKDNLSTMSSNDGLFNPTGFWKIKKKIFPKNGKALPNQYHNVSRPGRSITNPLPKGATP